MELMFEVMEIFFFFFFLEKVSLPWYIIAEFVFSV